MRIELFDMDVPYTLTIETNDNGKDFIKIESSGTTAEDKSICLDKDGISQLIRVLNFMKGEMQ